MAVYSDPSTLIDFIVIIRVKLDLLIFKLIGVIYLKQKLAACTYRLNGRRLTLVRVHKSGTRSKKGGPA
jgi:hypothetical protein